MLKTSLKWLVLMMSWLAVNCYANIPVNTSLAPMLEKVMPSIVNIRAQIKVVDFATLSRLQKESRAHKKNDSDQPIPDKMISVGSGVIIDAKHGYILTNAHVVEDAKTVIVTLDDGRHYNAKIIGMDKASDIALLSINAKNLTAIAMGDSNNLKVGDVVAAIGNPYGLNQTVSSGIVSALGRAALGIENYENFIQTDASINPGNSGGALINSQGQLVGINTAILAPTRGSVGIGFAIPANIAKSVAMQLIQFGDVKRGALGIGAQDMTPELATAFHFSSTHGAAVTEVMPNSPADKAGLQIGDIITSINGAHINNANDVVNAIAFLRVNSKANIAVLRNNKPITLSTTITDPKQRKDDTAKNDPLLYGVSLKDFTIFDTTHGDVKGVLVVNVEEDSNAWHADLRPGDVIVSADQHKITSITELKTIATNTKDSLLVNVIRGAGAVFLVINKES